MTTVSGVPLADLVAHFGFDVVTAAEVDMDRRLITTADLNRPGLQWSGYSDYFKTDRIQVIGRSEVGYLRSLPEHVMWDRLEAYCRQGVPAVLLARDLEVDPAALTLAERYHVPVLRTPMATSAAITAVHTFLADRLAPSILLHAGLVDVAGEGVMIMGASGVGKSEAALELIRRGHLLVADDAVEVRRPYGEVLIGASPEAIRHFLEVRGIGIVDLKAMFGIASVRSSCTISMVAWLQFASVVQSGVPLETTRSILDVRVPQVTIPVQPGRNPAVLIEVAALNQRAGRIATIARHQNGAS